MKLYNQSMRAKLLMQSEIRNMSIECDAIGGINLAQGICDLPLADILADAVLKAMKDGENHYTRYDGVEFLRKQIARKAINFNKINTSPENIIVSAGATGALYSACYALFSPGDEVILFQPYYGYHEYTLISLNVVPVFSNLIYPNWDIDYDNLETVITKKTKAIIICTPSNPCGKVFTKNELEKLGDFCIQHNLIILTDEIYEYITYDEAEHVSPASIPELADRTITISGYSKTFSITGWRIGYSIANEDICKWIGNANDLIYVCAPAPLQYGVAAAIETLSDEFYLSLKDNFQIRRNLLCDTLAEIGLQPFIPKGAYYVLADVSTIPGHTSKEKAIEILLKTDVGTVPGDAFYKEGKGANFVRFCFAKKMAVIEQACDGLRKLRK
ncbi:pyridoxal phosphate-dependent aminotransferase [Lachnospiraceae bacterium ZAX-1]